MFPGAGWTTVAARYRMRRLADDELHSQEKALYEIMYVLASTSPAYDVHEMQAMCLMRSILAGLLDYNGSLSFADKVLQRYDPAAFSARMAKIYGNDRAPHTLSLAAQDLALLGHFCKLRAYIQHVQRLQPAITHLHSAGILVLPLAPLLVMLGRYQEADDLFAFYFNMQESKGPQAYSFFREANPLFRHWLYLACSAHSDGDNQQQQQRRGRDESMEASLRDTLPVIMSKKYLGSASVNSRPLMYEATASFWVGMEFTCAAILCQVLQRSSSAGSQQSRKQMLSVAMEYAQLSLVVCAASNRFAFSYFFTLIILMQLVDIERGLNGNANDCSARIRDYLSQCESLANRNRFPFVAVVAAHYRSSLLPTQDEQELQERDQ